MEKAGVKSVCDNHVLVELMRVPIWGTQLTTTGLYVVAA